MTTLIRPINVLKACCFIGLVLVVLGTEFVSAQGITRESVGAGDYGDFVVGPGKVELPLNPGETRVVEMTVTNRMGEERLFNIEVEDAAGSRDASRPIVLLGDDTGPYTLKDYLSVPEWSFRLKAGERARIPVTISIPADSEPGGRYGSVLVTTTSVGNDPELASDARSGSVIISRIGTLFFITTPGKVELEGQLEQFSTTPEKKVYNSGPINFAILFENAGSIHLNPYGAISITNMLGEEVGFVELDPWYALPQSLRYREVEWGREFLFGRYTATLELNRGYNDIVDTSTVTFWVLPVHIVGPLVGGLVLIVLMIRYMATRFEFRRKTT